MTSLARVAVVVAVSFLATSMAQADTPGTLAGTVKDANGQALKGAEIRIQGRDPGRVGKVHTGAQGDYRYVGLETGTYSVTLLVNNAVKASISNVRTESGQTQTLNFALVSGSAAKPFAKGKHYVWVPSPTGTNIAGRWMEVDDSQPEMSVGMQQHYRSVMNKWVKDVTDPKANISH
jgi:carboxypeptidase family protein